MNIPKDHPVQPLKPGEEAIDKVTCGHCGLSWDDGKVTSYTPAPAARCPFEYWHEEDPRHCVKCDLCGELVSQSEADEADEIAERMLGEEWARNNNTCRECADGLSPDDPVGNLPKTDKS